MLLYANRSSTILCCLMISVLVVCLLIFESPCHMLVATRQTRSAFIGSLNPVLPYYHLLWIMVFLMLSMILSLDWRLPLHNLIT
ncbi:uncharacterized protein BX664DRAFT_332655, partial [Halteromyces radiatus]|uniref:uncharacterized protein n=1 Tax=Halteromyces radiatus TaxID=101107 RepID=UPI00222077FA